MQVFLQGKITLAHGNILRTFDARDLYYDRRMKAFRFVDDEEIVRWVLREHVLELSEVR